ncbi:MAG: MerR family transcriptional regulator [Sandaracinaceae bacterium]|nr:MerR family transcriptional regulator [Sandaracinaceae bacterium]
MDTYLPNSPSDSERPSSESPPPEAPLRMKDLCEATGLPRQVIHFYIQQGLLPQGHKKGRNMAYYTHEHLRRLRLIKKLQEERLLPLKAIRAILNDQEEHFSAAQRTLLFEIKQHLGATFRPENESFIDAAELCERNKVPLSDVERMAELGIIGLRREGGLQISASDSWLILLWSQVRGLLGQTPFEVQVDDLVPFVEVVDVLFSKELNLLSAKMNQLPPCELGRVIAQVIEKAMPLVHSLIQGLHLAKIRNFLASLDEDTLSKGGEP